MTAKGITFRSKESTEVFVKLGLNRLLESIEPVDFAIAANADDEKKLEKIRNLRHLLTIEDFRDKFSKIIKELKTLEEVCFEDKITLVILNFLEKTEELPEKLRIFEDGVYRIYTDKTHCWKSVDGKIMLLFLSELAEKSGIKRIDVLKKRTLETLKYQFDLLAHVNTPAGDPDEAKINLQNGTFVVSKNFIGLREHRADDYFKYILPFKYDENAKCPDFKSFLNRSVPEMECQMALSEFAAYPLARGLKMEKALVLFGPGGTGKSTFQTILSRMYGEENVGPYSLSALCGKRDSCAYNRADMVNFVVIYSTEMGDSKDNDDNMVKQIISREPVTARKPYGEPFTIRDYCPVMFNVNEMPPMENTSAMRRRFYIIPFLNKIPAGEMDVEFADRITEKELSGVFNWVLDGLKRLMKNKKFTVSPLSEKITNNLWMESDNVLAFVELNNLKPDVTDFRYSTELYAEYKMFCKENNYRSLSSIKFLKRLEGLGFKVDRNAPNHNIRVYCKSDLEVTKSRKEELDKTIENFMFK